MKRLALSGAKSPCMDCEDRQMGCHAKCPRYAAFAQECAEIRHRKWLEKDVDQAVSLALGRCTSERRV